MIALCDFRGDKLQQTGFAPCLINGENQAVPVASSNADFHRVKAYVEQIGETAGLRTRYEQGRIRGIDCILIKG